MACKREEMGAGDRAGWLSRTARALRRPRTRVWDDVLRATHVCTGADACAAGLVLAPFSSGQLLECLDRLRIGPHCRHLDGPSCYSTTLAGIMLDVLQSYTGCPPSTLQFLHLPRETLLVRIHILLLLCGVRSSYRAAISVCRLCCRVQCKHSCLPPRPCLLGGLSLNPSHTTIGTMSYRREHHESGMRVPRPASRPSHLISPRWSRLSVIGWSPGVFQVPRTPTGVFILLSCFPKISKLPLSTMSLVGLSFCHPTQPSSLAGLLAVGTRSSLSVYTLTLENDLPTWSMKWSSTYALHSYMLPCMYIHLLLNSLPTLSRVRFSPSLMYIATTSLVSTTG